MQAKCVDITAWYWVATVTKRGDVATAATSFDRRLCFVDSRAPHSLSVSNILPIDSAVQWFWTWCRCGNFWKITVAIVCARFFGIYSVAPSQRNLTCASACVTTKGR